MSFAAPVVHSPSNPDGITPDTSTGKIPQAPSDITILRQLMSQIQSLQNALSTVGMPPGQGITFTSPDGNTKMTLSINNSGEAVWTATT